MTAKRAESVSDMADSFLACRDKGHHWVHLNDKITATGRTGKIREVSRWWSCKGCSTQVTEVFTVPSCEVKSRTYTYPDGYLLTKGVDRLSVRDVRRQIFARNGIHF